MLATLYQKQEAKKSNAKAATPSATMRSLRRSFVLGKALAGLFAQRQIAAL
jgi:hypothetical protein